MSTNTFFIQSGSIFFISGTLEPSQSISESIVVDGDNAGTTESIVLSSTFKPEESAVGFLSLDNDFTSFFISGSTASSSLYFSGSGEIGFGTKDPKNEFDIKADTFKIRSRDGKKETEFRAGRLVSKKFKGGAGAETTGSQLVLSYTPGTFESPTIAQAGDILGSLTWEDLSIGNRDDATALRIQGKVDAVADGGVAIKGSMRFQIGDSQAGQPINEIAILDLTGFYISGSNRKLGATHNISIGIEPQGSTPDDDADRTIMFRNDTSNKNWTVGVNESVSQFQIHQAASLTDSSPDFKIDTSGNVTIVGSITAASSNITTINGGSF